MTEDGLSATRGELLEMRFSTEFKEKDIVSDKVLSSARWNAVLRYRKSVEISLIVHYLAFVLQV
jgi:hypothetical protein